MPRSTVSTWQRRGLRPVVTVEIIDQNRQQPLESIARLDRRARVLAAVVRLLLALLRVSASCAEIGSDVIVVRSSGSSRLSPAQDG